jgi:hypothetical protein
MVPPKTVTCLPAITTRPDTTPRLKSGNPEIAVQYRNIGLNKDNRAEDWGILSQRMVPSVNEHVKK